MAVYSQTNPKGIDLRIDRIQRDIERRLDWTNFDIYGRLYANERDGKKVIEAHISNNDYKEIFIDDKKTAVIGFLVGENRSGFNIIKVPVQLICSCMLNKIYDSTERKDEYVLLEMLKLIEKHTHYPNEKQVKTKFSEVFANTDISRIKFRDMHPWFNFSIEFDLIYKNNI
ncbi:MAG: hypothetical protein WC933_03530 [Candidatus Paceibacterota bacterium]|jgi:hypothetical protein